MRKLIVEVSSPIRLKLWLCAQFPMLSKRVIRDLLHEKDIRVNGSRTGEDIDLHPGDEVAIYAIDSVLDGPLLEVVYCSAELLVAVKPVGVSSVANGETDMEALASRWLEGRGEPAFVKACHRLDNQTGGLMMLARSEDALLAVRKLMEAGSIVKTYYCIVKGKPKVRHTTMKAWIKKDAARAFVTVLDNPSPGARTAVTEYELIRTDGRRSLLMVTLHTGRTHQIRAHMAHIGYPLLGDDKYGDRDFNKEYKARNQKLWASGLRFDFLAENCGILADLAGKSFESVPLFIDELQDYAD